MKKQAGAKINRDRIANARMIEIDTPSHNTQSLLRVLFKWREPKISTAGEVKWFRKQRQEKFVNPIGAREYLTLLNRQLLRAFQKQTTN